MSEMIQNQATGANAQTTIQKQAMQKWLAVQVEKFHQAGYQITAQKLGCNPVREELEEAISKIYTDATRMRNIMDALDRNEDRIQKKKKKNCNGVKKSKAKRIQAAEEEKKKEFLKNEMELELDNLSQLLKLEEKAYDDCAEELSQFLQDANENKNSASKLCAQLEFLYVVIDDLENLARAVALEQKQHGEKIVQLNGAIETLQSEIDQANAMHCTLESGCVSEDCQMVYLKYAGDDLVNKYLMQVLTEPYRFPEDFKEMVSIATVEEIREVAKYMAFTEKLSADNNGKKIIWYFEKKRNTAELLEFAGYDVVIKEEE